MKPIPFQLNKNLGYGAWLLPDGTVFEATDGFKDTHAHIVCEYFDLNPDEGFQYDVGYQNNWIRLLYPTHRYGGFQDLGVDIYGKKVSREQIEVITKLADYAFAKGLLVYVYTDHPNVASGAYSDPKPFFRELKKCQTMIQPQELTQIQT
jgi:hypothetical protein